MLTLNPSLSGPRVGPITGQISWASRVAAAETAVLLASWNSPALRPEILYWKSSSGQGALKDDLQIDILDRADDPVVLEVIEI